MNADDCGTCGSSFTCSTLKLPITPTIKNLTVPISNALNFWSDLMIKYKVKTTLPFGTNGAKSSKIELSLGTGYEVRTLEATAWLLPSSTWNDYRLFCYSTLRATCSIS